MGAVQVGDAEVGEATLHSQTSRSFVALNLNPLSENGLVSRVGNPSNNHLSEYETCGMFLYVFQVPHFKRYDKVPTPE